MRVWPGQQMGHLSSFFSFCLQMTHSLFRPFPPGEHLSNVYSVHGTEALLGGCGVRYRQYIRRQTVSRTHDIRILMNAPPTTHFFLCVCECECTLGCTHTHTPQLLTHPTKLFRELSRCRQSEWTCVCRLCDLTHPRILLRNCPGSGSPSGPVCAGDDWKVHTFRLCTF